MLTSQTYSPVIAPDGGRILGMSAIVSIAHGGGDMMPLWSQLQQRVAANPADAGAYVDLSMILQSLGRSDDALLVLTTALGLKRQYRVVHGDGSGLRILAFVRPGDFMANTPLDFLLAGSNAVLWLYFIDETTTVADVPAHDVAFMAIGEANDSAPYLNRVKHLLRGWSAPVMNNRTDLIGAMTRDRVSQLLADAPGILSPGSVRVGRGDLLRVTVGDLPLSVIMDGLDFPFIVRPVGTHAGIGLSRIAGRDDLVEWLDMQAAEAAYLAPFIDYRNADGMYQKQRIVLIDGKPFASHMATSTNWMVHYMNAEMVEHADRRRAEQDWMETFDQDFAVRHRSAFDWLYHKLPLHYFGIDCAEMPDGRLLVFEVDVAMIVHDMDDEILFPYKKPAMRKLFNSFLASAERAARIAL